MYPGPRRRTRRSRSSWEQLAAHLRLDEDDPVAAWRERVDVLVASPRGSPTRRFDALHFAGRGTDLTVGLLPTSTLHGGALRDRRRHRAHAEPADRGGLHDARPARASTASCARPSRSCVGGTIVRGLEVAFRGRPRGRIDADEGAEVLRGYVERDEGAARLGEVALVDGEGRIGPLDTVFYDTLLDENAASHIALGAGLRVPVGRARTASRVNECQIHIDFMIGSPDARGRRPRPRTATRVPVLRGGAWQI